MNLDNLSNTANTLEEANLIIKELVSLVKAQQIEIDTLKADMEELRNKQGKSSQNSSKAPSTDSPEQRSKRKKKPRSSRSQGAQPGHKKHDRALLPEDQVDDIKRYFPHSKCPCGAGLILDREPSYRHQVFDLPEVRYRVTEHQVYSG